METKLIQMVTAFPVQTEQIQVTRVHTNQSHKQELHRNYGKTLTAMAMA
jgi:predicted RNase H-like nuclease (RuvC/YqgF family)